MAGFVTRDVGVFQLHPQKPTHLHAGNSGKRQCRGIRQQALELPHPGPGYTIHKGIHRRPGSE